MFKTPSSQSQPEPREQPEQSRCSTPNCLPLCVSYSSRVSVRTGLTVPIVVFTSLSDPPFTIPVDTQASKKDVEEVLSKTSLSLPLTHSLAHLATAFEERAGIILEGGTSEERDRVVKTFSALVLGRNSQGNFIEPLAFSCAKHSTPFRLRDRTVENAQTGQRVRIPGLLREAYEGNDGKGYILHIQDAGYATNDIYSALKPLKGYRGELADFLGEDISSRNAVHRGPQTLVVISMDDPKVAPPKHEIPVDIKGRFRHWRIGSSTPSNQQSI